MKLRDISKYQGVIDYDKLKIDGLIIRAGYRAYGDGLIYEDKMLTRNTSEADRVSIPYGLYFYSQAINENEAMLEALYLVQEANKHPNILFLALDMELTGSGRGRADQLRPETRQAIANRFRTTVSDAGYQPVIYSNENYFKENLNYNSDYYINWVANWSKKPTIPTEIWQYTNKGKLDGISTVVDLNETEWTISDFTGKDHTHELFKQLKTEIDRIGELVQKLESNFAK